MPDVRAAEILAESGRRRRLVFFTTGLGTGGAEMMLFKLVSALRSEFDCTVVSLRDRGTVGPRIAGLGVPVEALELHRPWRLPGVGTPR